MSTTGLLKDNAGTQSYGAASSSNLEAGVANGSNTATEPNAETRPFEWWGPATKQILAGISVLLSGGAKIAELIICKSYATHDPFEPTRGMIILAWVGIYALQLDFVYMLGHETEPTDPKGYAATRELAVRKAWKFILAHSFLALWQLFKILQIPIASLVSIILAWFFLASMYINLHRARPDRRKRSTHDHSRVATSSTSASQKGSSLSPSFLQGPISALLIITSLVWMPDSIISLALAKHPNSNLQALMWPLAIWLLIANFIGSHITTRPGYISNKKHEQNSAFRAALAEANGETPVGTDQRMVPVDLAGVLALFWLSLSIAGGVGKINYGPVEVAAYLGALWQGLAIIGAII